MRFVIVAVAVAATAPVAHAQPAHAQPGWVIDLFPTTVGVGHVSGNGDAATLGWRPQLLLADVHGDADDPVGFGVGVYVGLTGAFFDPTTGWASTGASVIGYLPHHASLALSLGVAAGDHHGAVPEASAFAGWRFQIPCDHCVAQIEVPIGLRLDARPGVGGAPTSFALAAEVDVVTIAVTLIRVMLEPHVPPG